MKLTELKPGDRLLLNYGCMCGSEEVTVTEVVDGRFGRAVRVVNDEGVLNSIGNPESTEKGIGWKPILTGGLK